MKRFLSFGIGTLLGVGLVWVVRRFLTPAAQSAPDMQKIAPMTAPVVAPPTVQSNGLHTNGKHVTLKTNINPNRPSTRPATVATDEPKAAEETQPSTRQSRADTDSDVAVPDAPVIEALETDTGDDFTLIRGIGDLFKQKLYAAGITTFQQLVDAPLDVLEEKAGIPAWRVEKDEIKEQAALLTTGERPADSRENNTAES